MTHIEWDWRLPRWDWWRSLSAPLRVLIILALLAGTVVGMPSERDTAPASAQAGEQNLAPTLPGAPFLPHADRVDHILQRYETLVALERLAEAERVLETRAVGVQSRQRTAQEDASTTELRETTRILDAQVASLERALADLEASEHLLLEETEAFGLGLAAFPVDEARKPFWDDWGRPRSGGRTHVGTDVLAQIGVPLRAIEDGVVETISGGGNGGNGIFMVGDSGSRWYYAHLDEVADLAPGDRVLAGQPVGTVGDSGNARGAPHLHMQWDPDGESNWQNPFPLLDVLFGEGRTELFAEQAAEALAAPGEPTATTAADSDAGIDNQDT